MSLRANTVLPADSAEFCPADDATDIFAIGTYKLEESTIENSSSATGQLCGGQRRSGKCLLFRTNGDDICELLQEIPMSAVLDMKWTSNKLGIADAEGNIRLYSFSPENRKLGPVEILKCSNNNEISISLSLDWCRYRSAYSSNKLAVSLSSGLVKIIDEVNGEWVATESWKAHDFEPWITAWDRWDLSHIYTGGDDCLLKGWDSRIGFGRPTFQNKGFEGGVTSIQSNPHLQHIIAVGSYDGRARAFDMRHPNQPIAEVDVGGGAWRVKWHPSPTRQHQVLVACMHDGFKVVDFECDDSSERGKKLPHITSRFDKHESLAYGVDWSLAAPTKDGTLVTSCSFYDHSMYLWRA